VVAGPQGLLAGAGEVGLSAFAGPLGLDAPWPAAVPAPSWAPGCRRAGPQGLLGPQGLGIVCAICIGLSAAATGVGAAAVVPSVAAIVDRLPTSRVDFSRLARIECSFSAGS